MKKKLYNFLLGIISYIARSKIEKYGKRVKLYANFSIGIGVLLSICAIYSIFNSNNIILGIIGAILLMLFAIIFLGVGFAIKKVLKKVPVDKLLNEEYLKNVKNLKNIKDLKNFKFLKDLNDKK